MRIFWKLFFNIMLVVQLCFSYSCVYLIQYNFDNSLENVRQTIKDNNDTVYYLFKNCIYDINNLDYLKEELLNNFSYQIINNDMMFAIIHENEVILNDIIFNHNIEEQLISHQGITLINYDERYSSVFKYENHYYINCYSVVEIENERYYLINYLLIDNLFENKHNQMDIMIKLIIIEFVISSIIILLLSNYLSYPIKQLSEATKKLSLQEYDVKLPINRKDELGILSRNFIAMANQINQNIEDLKEYNQKQETFIHNFTHELKTPLTSIIGYADMIRSKRLKEEELIISANQIVTEGKRLERISKKLMNMIILKNQQIDFQFVSTLVFFETIKNTVKPLMEKENIQLDLDIEESFLYIDSDLIEDALLNIIDNAINAIENNGIIKISGKKNIDTYRIIVEDNGKGISEDDIDKICEAFYMTDKSRTRLHGGAGLGLALVKVVVEAHSGSIEFNSQLDRGTQVIIDLKAGDNND